MKEMLILRNTLESKFQRLYKSKGRTKKKGSRLEYLLTQMLEVDNALYLFQILKETKTIK